MGRENSEKRREQLMILRTSSCFKHGGGNVIAWSCMIANGLGSLVFSDSVIADRTIKMNSKVY